MAATAQDLNTVEVAYAAINEVIINYTTMQWLSIVFQLHLHFSNTK